MWNFNLVIRCWDAHSFGGESLVQIQTFWRNKHLESHQILLWSGAVNWQEMSSEIVTYLLGLKSGFIFTPVDQPDCSSDGGDLRCPVLYVTPQREDGEPESSQRHTLDANVARCLISLTHSKVHKPSCSQTHFAGGERNFKQLPLLMEIHLTWRTRECFNAIQQHANPTYCIFTVRIITDGVLDYYVP